jgi:hypothetical protein
MPHNYDQPNSIAIPIEYHTQSSTTTRVANQFTIQSDNVDVEPCELAAKGDR